MKRQRHGMPFVLPSSPMFDSYEIVRAPEPMPAAIYDGGDINEHGCWRGEEMCCLSCKETRPMEMGHTGKPYFRNALECGECGQTFAEVLN